MSGIAAEAIMYGKADGGAGDEQALIRKLYDTYGGRRLLDARPISDFEKACIFSNFFYFIVDHLGFLSNLNGGSSSSAPIWNDLTIRNQARW